MGALAVGLGATVKAGRDFLNTELLELGRSPCLPGLFYLCFVNFGHVESPLGG